MNEYYPSDEPQFAPRIHGFWEAAMGIISKQLVFGVIGVWAFFLGLVTLGDGLQRVSSDRMRKIPRL